MDTIDVDALVERAEQLERLSDPDGLEKASRRATARLGDARRFVRRARRTGSDEELPRDLDDAVERLIQAAKDNRSLDARLRAQIVGEANAALRASATPAR